MHPLFSTFSNWCLIFQILDGTSTGDGSTEADGMYQKEDSTRKCLSSGECRPCKYITDEYEGCDITSTTPICDANTAVANIQFDTSSDYVSTSLIPVCVACKKAGEFYYLFELKWW